MQENFPTSLDDEENQPIATENKDISVDDSLQDNIKKGKSLVFAGERYNVRKTKKKIILVMLCCFFVIVMFVSYHFILTKKQNKDKNDVYEKGSALEGVKPNYSLKFLDLSGYDMEKSKKLWSEESFFVFDKWGYSVQVPLIKKGMEQGGIVIGHKNGRTWELGEYAKISPNGNYLLYLQRDTFVTDMDVSCVVLIDANSGEILWKSPLINSGKAELKIKSMFFDGDSHAHLFLEQDNNSVIWYRDGKNILTINNSDYLKQITMLAEKNKLAVVSHEDVTFKVIFNGNVIVPQWKYPSKPLACLLVSFLENEHILFSCFNASVDVFFSNDEVVAEYDFKDFSKMIANIEGEPTYSSDGKRMAFVSVNESGGKFVRVLGEEKKVFRKEYSGNSTISDVSFDPNSQRIYYKVTTAQGDKRKTYAVVDETEEGPYGDIDTFVWGSESVYAYTAYSEIEEDKLVVVNGKTIKVIKSVQSNYDDVEVENLEIMNGGKVFFCEVRTVFSEAFKNSLKVTNGVGAPSYSAEKGNPFEFRTICNYDGKDTPEYQGLLGGWKVSFSQDKKHFAYPVFSGNKKIVVLDGKEISFDGDFLGSWSGEAYGFSDDGKRFGIYVMKDNGIWRIEYLTE